MVEGRNEPMRSGTENVAGIVGLVRAFELANESMQSHRVYIEGLKLYMIERLRTQIPNISFNGDLEGLYTILSVVLPSSISDIGLI